MYVVSGRLKGEVLKVPLHTRPTSNRVRKSLFSILKDELEDKEVLDLYAGSGSLGIEALSVGAKSCHFVDIKKRCIEIIRQNLTNLNLLHKGILHCKSSLKAIKDFYSEEKKFDIIFADPPYYKDEAFKLLQTLDCYDILSPSGLFILQVFLKDKIFWGVKKYKLILKKRFGQDLILFFTHV